MITSKFEPLPTPTRTGAAKFLGQASMGGGIDEIDNIVSLGFEAWLEKQFSMPRTVGSLFDWMLNQGYAKERGEQASGNTGSIDHAVWRSLILSQDTLRQRVALALSQIFVVGFDGVGTSFRNFGLAAYMDLLIDNSFGNYRTLIEKISRNAAMSVYLTFDRNKKAAPDKTRLPDENYAREIMQLFSIGLYELNPNGTLKLSAGKPVETYDQSDIMGLARVFTGWVWDMSKTPIIKDANHVNGKRPENPFHWALPLVQRATLYETGEKSFLGTTIPAGKTANESLKIALDTLYNHPNVGPFIGTQLIQRLVKSNPSPEYVERVTQAFNSGKYRNFGSGKRGDLKAVIAAILLDKEAHPAKSDDVGRKIREPILRLTHWARAFNLSCPNGKWKIADLTDPGWSLGQSTLRSPSVFNFFRPGYIPQGTKLADKKLRAPEFQITDEVSVAGYLNFLQKFVRLGIEEAKSNPTVYYKPDYTRYINMANIPEKMVSELNLVLTAGRLSAAKEKSIVQAINTVQAKNTSGKEKRVVAAITLIMASPEFIVLN